MKKEVFAIVEGRELTTDLIDFYRQQMGGERAHAFDGAEGIERLKTEIINQELYYVDALKNGLDKDEEYLKKVELMKEQLLRTYAIHKTISKIEISDEELKDYYEKNSAKYSSAESVRAAHILISTEDEGNEIVEKLKAGETFETLASTQSNCPSKENGGDLGYFSRGQMVPEFEQKAFSMNVGEVSEPIKSQFGYHIIKLLDKRAAGAKDFDSVKESIRATVFNIKQNEAFYEKAKSLMKEYKVEMIGE